MTPSDVLRECQKRRVVLSTDNGRLKFVGPAGAIGPDLKQTLAEHKAALLELVGPCPKCSRPMDALKCWHCNYRRCRVCNRGDTGSALISMCLRCQLDEEQAP